MSGYIGPIPVPQGIQNKETFTATAGQTTFNTNGYTDGAFINVYLNGVRLINGTDYTATNGSDIVLTQAASVSDVLDFETFNEFQLVSSTQTTPTFKTSATLKNDTEEDTDGGRESTLIFKGEQSGGEISTLAEIEASHHGTADDEKGNLIFRTNDGSDGASPTEAFRVYSNQSVYFGSATSDDDQKYQMIKTGGSVGLGLHSNRAAVGGSALILSHNRNTSIGSFTALNNSDQLGRITFQGSDGTDIKTEGAQIHAEINGTVGSNDLPTDLVFSTTADGAAVITERMRILESGGITFNGDTSADNALSDYEEGTWTPSLTTGTATASNAWYLKVGKLVTVSCKLDTFSDTTSSSSVIVSGIPYASKTTGHTAQGSMIANHFNGDTFFPYLSSNSSSVFFYNQETSTSYQSLIHSFLGSSASFYFTITYRSEA